MGKWFTSAETFRGHDSKIPAKIFRSTFPLFLCLFRRFLFSCWGDILLTFRGIYPHASEIELIVSWAPDHRPTSSFQFGASTVFPVTTILSPFCHERLLEAKECSLKRGGSRENNQLERKITVRSRSPQNSPSPSTLFWGFPGKKEDSVRNSVFHFVFLHSGGPFILFIVPFFPKHFLHHLARALPSFFPLSSSDRIRSTRKNNLGGKYRSAAFMNMNTLALPRVEGTLLAIRPVINTLFLLYDPSSLRSQFAPRKTLPRLHNPWWLRMENQRAESGRGTRIRNQDGNQSQKLLAFLPHTVFSAPLLPYFPNLEPLMCSDTSTGFS